MAGVHRAPVAAALILAAVRQLPFDRMMQHIQKLRAVEPHKMIKGDVGEWVLYCKHWTVAWTASQDYRFHLSLRKLTGPLMHAVPKDWGTQIPQLQHAAGARAKLTVEVFLFGQH